MSPAPPNGIIQPCATLAPGQPLIMSTASYTLFGIPNCDTVKKARVWLDQHGVAYQFHDFKKAGLDQATVAGWCAQQPWDVLVNKRGTTWRQLPADEQQAIVDATTAQQLMVKHTSVIKRPVVVRNDTGEVLAVGFDAQRYAGLFNVG